MFPCIVLVYRPRSLRVSSTVFLVSSAVFPCIAMVQVVVQHSAFDFSTFLMAIVPLIEYEESFSFFSDPHDYNIDIETSLQTRSRSTVL